MGVQSSRTYLSQESFYVRTFCVRVEGAADGLRYSNRPLMHLRHDLSSVLYSQFLRLRKLRALFHLLRCCDLFAQEYWRCLLSNCVSWTWLSMSAATPPPLLSSYPKRSMVDLLTFPLSLSISRGTSTQSALTAYHLGPMSLALGMRGSSN